MDNANDNKPRDNDNNNRLKVNASGGKKEKKKVKFPCKLCTNDHLTHLCMKLEEDVRILTLPPTVLNNPFPHNQHLASSSSNSRNAVSGSQNPLRQDGDRLCINMVKSQVNVATRSYDYSSSHTFPGLKSPPPL
jgi:hypothetical protein